MKELRKIDKNATICNTAPKQIVKHTPTQALLHKTSHMTIQSSLCSIEGREIQHRIYELHGKWHASTRAGTLARTARTKKRTRTARTHNPGADVCRAALCCASFVFGRVCPPRFRNPPRRQSEHKCSRWSCRGAGGGRRGRRANLEWLGLGRSG